MSAFARTLQPAKLVRPAEHRLEVLVDLRRDEPHRPDDDPACAPVDRQLVAFGERRVADAGGARLQVDRECLAAGDARLAHPPCDDGRVRRHAAVDGEDPLGGDHPVNVVGRRLPADEDHRLVLAACGRRVCVEDDLAARRARARVQPRRRNVVARLRIEHRVQQLVELRGIDPRNRVLTRDQPFVDHVDRRLQRGSSGPLRGSGLEEEELPLLDGELDVLHVAVVLLEPAHRFEELLVRLRQARLHRLERLRRPNSRDDVLALRVREELAVEPLLARRRVAREAHAGATVVALVSEDHLHDVDCGAEVVGDPVRPPVDVRTRGFPRVEDRPHRTPQLLACVLGEPAARRLAVDPVERLDQLAEVVGGELGVLRGAALRLQVGERLLEPVPVHPVDDLAVHLDQPSIGVARETWVAGAAGEPFDGDVVQPEVEDRVHHPGHRDRGTGAHGDEQWVLRVAEALPGLRLEPLDVLGDLVVEAGRNVPLGHVRAARVGRDREPGGNGNAELRHLGQADPLAPEELAPAGGRLVEGVHVGAHGA